MPSQEIRRLSNEDYPELYSLMIQEAFPDTPEAFEEAKGFFSDTINYGVFDGEGRLQVGFIFGDLTHNSAFFDILCDGKARGKWATKRVVRRIMDIAFKELNLDFIWMESSSPEAIRAAITAGFEFTTDVEVDYTDGYTVDWGDRPMLILTKNKAKYFKG